MFHHEGLPPARHVPHRHADVSRWWRAFGFADFMQPAGGDSACALESMREREKKLFGSSDDGQGRFLIRVRHGELGGSKARDVLGNGAGGRSGQTVRVGTRYLGYGLMGAFGRNAGRLDRGCFAAGQSFEVDILFRPKATDADKAETATALKLLGLLGGLGARVRRGWGSLSLQTLEGCGQGWQGPQNRKEYTDAIEDLFRNHPGRHQNGTDWPLTAFAKESGVWIGQKADAAALGALDRLGDGFLRYRGWRNGDKNFPEDHDWYKRHHGRPNTVPRRTAFGLPHNYAKCLGVTAADIGPPRKKDERDRRGSPLLFHVHSFERSGLSDESRSSSVAAITYLPTRFTENGQVGIERGEGPNRAKTPAKYDFHADGDPVIKAFLQGLRRYAPRGRGWRMPCGSSSSCSTRNSVMTPRPYGIGRSEISGKSPE